MNIKLLRSIFVLLFCVWNDAFCMQYVPYQQFRLPFNKDADFSYYVNHAPIKQCKNLIVCARNNSISFVKYSKKTKEWNLWKNISFTDKNDLRTPTEKKRDTILSLALYRDKKNGEILLAAGSFWGTIRIWSINIKDNSIKFLVRIEQARAITSITFREDGKKIFCCDPFTKNILTIEKDGENWPDLSTDNPVFKDVCKNFGSSTIDPLSDEENNKFSEEWNPLDDAEGGLEALYLRFEQEEKKDKKKNYNNEKFFNDNSELLNTIIQKISKCIGCLHMHLNPEEPLFSLELFEPDTKKSYYGVTLDSGKLIKLDIIGQSCSFDICKDQPASGFFQATGFSLNVKHGAMILPFNQNGYKETFVEIWRNKNDKWYIEKKIKNPHNKSVQYSSFSEKGNYCALGRVDGTVSIYESKDENSEYCWIQTVSIDENKDDKNKYKTSPPSTKFSTKSRIAGVTFSRDRKFLIVVNSRGTLQFYKAKDEKNNKDL